MLHWADGADGRGVLLSGDTIFVTPGEDRVTFVWSAPNRLPLSEAAVRGVWEAVRPYAFDRIYGGWWTPVLRSGALGDRAAVGCAVHGAPAGHGLGSFAGDSADVAGSAFSEAAAQGPGAGGGVPAQFVYPGRHALTGRSPRPARIRVRAAAGLDPQAALDRRGLATIPG